MGETGFLEKPENIAAITTVSLVSLGVLQIILGETISKSVALTANGIDCIGDGFVSAVVWLGLKVFRRPADHKFHFGYYKIENVASILAAAVMLVLAGYIVYRSYWQFVDPVHVEFPLLGAGVAFFAALVSWGLGGYKYFKSKQQKLGSYRLDALNTIKDGTASFLAVIALLFDSIGLYVADAIVGFIIAGIIVMIGFTAIKESGLMLVDACDQSCIDHRDVIQNVVESVDGVLEAHVVRLRRTGPVMQGEIEVVVDEAMTVKELHRIRQEIHAKAQEQVPDIERLIITAVPKENK